MNLIHLKYIRVQEAISPSTHKHLCKFSSVFGRHLTLMNIPAKEEEGSCGRMLNQQWFLIADRSKALSTSFVIVCLWPNSSF
jgi:hypothetical protein